MNKKILVSIFIVAIVCLGAGFFAGWEYEKSQSPLAKFGKDGQQMFQRIGANANNAAGSETAFGSRGGGFVNGEVLSKDNQSITVKLREGGSKIVFFSTSTEISKFTTGNLADLSVGASIMVNGKTNSDGSITAQTIQLRPMVGVSTSTSQ